MTKRTHLWMLAGVLVLATFLRFYHFTTTPPGLYPDEAIDGNNAAEAAATNHFQVFYIEDNGREGLYVNLVSVLLKIFPVHEAWIIRLPAAVAGVLTVLGIYLLVLELFNEKDERLWDKVRRKLNSGGSASSLTAHAIALLSAFFLATSFWHINFSRIGFRAILAPLLLTWALYLLLKAFRAASANRAMWLAIAAGVVYSLGFYTYIAYRITPLLFLLFIPFFKKYPDFWKRAAIFTVAIILVGAPIGIYFLQHPGDFLGRTSQVSIMSSGNPLQVLSLNVAKTLAMFNFQGDGNWRHNVSGAPQLFWPVGILFLIGIALCLIPEKSGVQSKKFSILVLFSWFALAALPVVFSNEGIPHALRSILMLPPAMIFAAIGGVWFYNMLLKMGWNVKLVNVIAALFLASVAIFAYVDYFIVWAGNENVPGSFNADYVTIGHEINALPAATPKYVIVNAGGVPVRGIPTPVETTMFITDTFTTSTQQAKNVHYLLPDQKSQIPAGTASNTIFEID